MRIKTQFRLLGWATLLVFPGIGWLLLWWINDVSLLELLDFPSFFSPLTLLGLELGLLYGFFIMLLSKLPFLNETPDIQTRLLKDLNLNWFDIVFIAFCAGFGEEILFRASIQTWLGPWVTTFIFIAIHGYFHPKSLQRSFLGIALFPFILILAYAYTTFGLWFCVAAHFSYDLLLFMGVKKVFS